MMKILIYGAGVIGCELAHELCQKNDVTILARGKWKKSIDDKGLIIKHYGQFKTTKDHIKTIEHLSAHDRYDIIFVVMQYVQILNILYDLAVNDSSKIVFIGNNINPRNCENKLIKNSSINKEVAFGFQGIGGYREKCRVVSMHFNKIKLKVGGLDHNISADFEKNLKKVFADTSYKLYFKHNMESYLLYHVVSVLPTCYICYRLRGKLSNTSIKQVKLAVLARNEGKKLLESLGYEKRLDNENNIMKCIKLYILMKSPAGKFVISNHCMNAVSEMKGLDLEFKKLREKDNTSMISWDYLRSSAAPIIEI